MSDKQTSGTDRPENWPETFSKAGESPQCPHQLTWDSAEGCYICIYGCGRSEDRPPKSAIEAREEFLEKRDERSTETETEQ